ncbi:MAG: hypothetical protein Q8N51_05700 [Gammaproteobacteria bacterium]|nr:hypothetical protein [Gammaproteobacteria bacterium]
MLDEVISFAIILIAFEFVILMMVPPKYRLRLLGNSSARVACHIVILLLNMWVHWGTVVGTMSATLSFVTSMFTLWVASKVFGFITEGRYYTVGLVKYSTEELT